MCSCDCSTHIERKECSPCSPFHEVFFFHCKNMTDMFFLFFLRRCKLLSAGLVSSGWWALPPCPCLWTARHSSSRCHATSRTLSSTRCVLCISFLALCSEISFLCTLTVPLIATPHHLYSSCSTTQPTTCIHSFLPSTGSLPDPHPHLPVPWKHAL